MPIEIQQALVQPLADVLARLGEGVAQAQRAMDLNAIATQTLAQRFDIAPVFGRRRRQIEI
jgi:hypothetical protein